MVSREPANRGRFRAVTAGRQGNSAPARQNSDGDVYGPSGSAEWLSPRKTDTSFRTYHGFQRWNMTR